MEYMGSRASNKFCMIHEIHLVNSYIHIYVHIYVHKAGRMTRTTLTDYIHAHALFSVLWSADIAEGESFLCSHDCHSKRSQVNGIFVVEFQTFESCRVLLSRVSKGQVEDGWVTLVLFASVSLYQMQNVLVCVVSCYSCLLAG